MSAAGTALLVAVLLVVALPARAGERAPEPTTPVVCTSCHASAPLGRAHPRLDAATPRPCQACHTPAANEWPAPNRFSTRLHRSHVREGGPVACAGCHVGAGTMGKNELSLLGGRFASWTRSPYLDAAHGRADVSCGGCHGTTIPVRGATVDASRCMACHGYYECLADRTAPARQPERNPHSSHLGQQPCTTCHKAHQPSRAVCLDCHPDFSMPIPPRTAP
jgi:hypothetical protein